MKGAFPPGFLWGSAISAHQVEGHNVHSDWWAWENSAAFTGRDRSGEAARHWELYETDFRLAHELGLNAQRLSLEWARIEPQPGRWSEEAMAHYRAVLDFLRRLGLRVFVTLHHFTNPRWVAERGGWLNPAVVEWFRRYVARVAAELADRVDFWNPINEATVYATYAHMQGLWPPQGRSFWGGWRVLKHMAKAHRAAYRVLHQAAPRGLVGTAHHLVAFAPVRPRSRLDRALAAVLGRLNNDWFLDAVRGFADFIGVNYYHRRRVRFSARAGPPYMGEAGAHEGPTNDLGWEIYPRGLYQQLLSLRRFALPVYVTENGLADAADRQRADFIRAHLAEVLRAIAEGMDVRGYFHWSLIDNYEWHLGFTPRFGLVAVDYTTQERRVRPSAQVLAAVARANALREELLTALWRGGSPRPPA